MPSGGLQSYNDSAIFEKSGGVRHFRHFIEKLRWVAHMQARFYAPMYGRFLSPDPARDQHFEDTQSWNIYSYVRNNPVMRVDPSGLFTWGNSLGGNNSDEDLLRKTLNSSVQLAGQSLDMLCGRIDVRAGLSDINSKIDASSGAAKADGINAKNAIGDEGQNNGVKIGSFSPGAASDEMGVTRTLAQNSGNGRHEIDLNLGALKPGDVGQALVHEGQHVFDRQKAIGMANSAPGMWGKVINNPNLNLSLFQREFNGNNTQFLLFGNIYGHVPGDGQTGDQFVNQFVTTNYGVSPEHQGRSLWP